MIGEAALKNFLANWIKSKFNGTFFYGNRKLLETLLLCAATLVGFLILFRSEDEFVISSIATRKNVSVSPMIIGVTVVAFGTSAPEIFVTITSSLQEEIHLAVCNAIGSNIVNVGLVTLALMFFATGKNQDKKISQSKGAPFLRIWLRYLVTLYNTSIAS